MIVKLYCFRLVARCFMEQNAQIRNKTDAFIIMNAPSFGPGETGLRIRFIKVLFHGYVISL